MRTRALLLIAAAVAAPAAAQEPGSRQTRDFVAAASQSDMFEMLEAHTALVQSGNPQVRAFAQRMIQDHDRLDRSLREATMRSGLRAPPPGISNDQAEFLAALQSARGAEFDRAYARHQALAHRSALVTEQAYAAGGDDAAVRKAATTAVPIISRHLNDADRLSVALGAS